MAGVRMRAGSAGATLTLMGDVGWDITAGGVAAALRDLGEQPLTVSLHSYGGDAFAGVAVHNMLARHKGPKTVIVEGVAASAASLIAMAGDRIVMPENAFLMIHNAWMGALGDSDAMRGAADLLDLVSGAYRQTYARRTGLAEEEVAALMAAETWMPAALALERGFATEIAAPAEVRADATRLGRFVNVPAALLALATPLSPPAPPAPRKETAMSDAAAGPSGPPPHTGSGVQPPAPAAPLRAAATVAELQGIAARAELGAEWVLAQLAAGVTASEATGAALDAAIQARRDGRVDAAAAGRPPIPGQSLHVTRDEGDTLRARLSGAFGTHMLATARGAAPQYAPEEREFAGMGFHALARELMAARGTRNVHRMDGVQLVEALLGGGGAFASGAMHTTSDFAGVLANTLNKTVRELYAAFPNTWSSWCDEVEVADYKQITAATIGQPSEVEAFAEGSQIQIGTIAEDPAETYQVSERGILLPVGKQALVNDDTRALTRAAQNLALGAYTGLRRVVFGILSANAAMADANPLFHASHSNLGTAGPMTATTLGALIALLDAMPGPTRAGRRAASLPPTTAAALITGSNSRRITLELLGGTIMPTQPNNALPPEMRALMQPVFDPLLNGAGTPQPYYAARTEPGLRPVEIAYIRGQRQPQISQAERIDYTGVTFRCLFDFGAKAVTWRTAAANLG